MTKTPKRDDSPGRPWQFFSSVKLTTVLLIALAVVSIAGTLIPQGQEGAEFAKRLSPSLLKLVTALDLLDIYHAVWFRLLMGLLALNLVICSLDRFPGAWNRFKTLPRADRRKVFEDLPPQRSFVVSAEPEEVSRYTRSLLGKKYRRLLHQQKGQEHFFYGERGRYSHFGVYGVHFSVLLILLGALVGSFFGFEAFVNIPEGERVGRVFLRSEMIPMALDFDVRCDDFSVDFYENGTPKAYISQLTFFVEDNIAQQSTVQVNHPATFRGVTFYQSTYGTIPGEDVQIRITRRTSDAESVTLPVTVGRSVLLPGGEGHFVVSDVRGDFMGMGPAVHVLVHPRQGEGTRFWVFKEPERIRERFPGIMEKFPRLNAGAFEPYTFALEHLETRFYTGLQVNKDPGVPLVWAGCFLMIAGFFVTFFISHRRFWVRVAGESGGTRVATAGTANKNPVGLDRELDTLTQHLRDGLTPKESR